MHVMNPGIPSTRVRLQMMLVTGDQRPHLCIFASAQVSASVVPNMLLVDSLLNQGTGTGYTHQVL